MREILSTILDGDVLSYEEARKLLEYLTADDLDPIAAGAALAGLRTRGETADEVRAFADGLQALAVKPELDVSRAVDVVGTGGDGSRSLNLSTGSALLAAAAGAQIVKHGNRSVSSQSGSFDVLDALGLDLPWGPDRAAEVYDRLGFTFLFAPAFHPAMKAVAPVRQAMGARTIFNMVGPLANPAQVKYMVVGAFSEEAAAMMAETLSGMDIERAFVVHGEPGWDEATPVGPYILHDVTKGTVRTGTEDPLDFGLARCQPTDLVGNGPEFNAEAIRRVFSGETGPHRDALVLGASLALRVIGTGVEEALQKAGTAIEDGSASALVAELTQQPAVSHV